MIYESFKITLRLEVIAFFLIKEIDLFRLKNQLFLSSSMTHNFELAEINFKIFCRFVI